MNWIAPTPAMTRRGAFVVAGTSLLSACSQASRSPFFSTLANFRRSATPAVDPSKVAALPYASLQAWFTGNTKALLVLGEYAPDRRLVWYSAQKQSLTTWGPFVMRLLGLEVDVRETRLNGAWSTDLREMVGRRVEKTVSFQTKTSAVTMRTRSVFRSAGLEQVDLIAGPRTVRLIEEQVVANGVRRFENRYWVDEATGFCWKSRQLLIPTMKPFNIEVAKAPRNT